MMGDGITVISQTTAERRQETRELFEQVRPLLDKGMIYSKAVQVVMGFPDIRSCVHRAWFRDLVEYGESQGYRYEDYSGKGGVKG